MEILNEIKFTMPSLSVNEGAARAVVSSFLIQADPTVEELSDIRTAVSEAVTNAVVQPAAISSPARVIASTISFRSSCPIDLSSFI